jgi:hypothetical protein
MQTKIERRDKTYGTLEAFPEFIERFTPPAADFDARGAWKQSYAVRLFAEDSGTLGFLEVERRPAADGAALTVATKLAHVNGFQEQNVKLQCAADALGSLRSMQLESVSSGLDGQLVAAAKLAIGGQVRGGFIEWTRAGRKRIAPAPPPVVANWALFDTVQRLTPDLNKSFEFTLLDDGDLIKPAQRLVYVGQTTVQAAGGANLSLHCWEQTGYGVLPTHYWVDGKGRLLFAIAGQKAFLYDPEARNNARGRNRGAGRKKA